MAGATRIILIAIGSVIVSGCATMGAQEREDLGKLIPICYDDYQCEAQWSAARAWVQKNSGFKFQIYSDDLIETYNPPENSARIAARVTKNLLNSHSGQKTYEIAVTLWCANSFGCQPDLTDSYRSFFDTVPYSCIK